MSSENPNQQSFNTGNDRPPRRMDDFLGILPHGVMPTGQMAVLERNGHVLWIKTYEHADRITGAQRRIWRLLSRISNLEGAPGNMTVACVWGLGPAAVRHVTIFDYQGEHPEKAMHLGDFRRWIVTWWHEAGRRGHELPR